MLISLSLREYYISSRRPAPTIKLARKQGDNVGRHEQLIFGAKLESFDALNKFVMQIKLEHVHVPIYLTLITIIKVGVGVGVET